MKKYFIFIISIFTFTSLAQPLNNLTTAFNLFSQSLKKLGTSLENLSKPSGPIQQQDMIEHEGWLKLALDGKPNLKKDFKSSTQSGINQNTKIPPKTNNIFRIMTYNVHYWTDPEGHWEFNQIYDTYDAIFNVIKAINPDILVLQEARTRQKDFKKSNTFKAIINSGYSSIEFCNTMPKINQWFGNIIASKYPFKKIVTEKFKAQERPGVEDRCYAQIEVTLPNGKQLLIYGTHLEVGKKDKKNEQPASELIRQKQLQEIISSIEKQNIPNALIAADFNSVRKKDYEYNILGKNVWDMLNEENRKRSGYFPTPTSTLDTLDAFGYVDSFSKLGWQGPKFTAWSGTVIDFIILARTWNLPLAGSYVYYDASSDHLPIIMDIDLTS